MRNEAGYSGRRWQRMMSPLCPGFGSKVNVYLSLLEGRVARGTGHVRHASPASDIPSAIAATTLITDKMAQPRLL